MDEGLSRFLKRIPNLYLSIPNYLVGCVAIPVSEWISVTGMVLLVRGMLTPSPNNSSVSFARKVVVYSYFGTMKSLTVESL
jgi:hypothetical protein